MAKAIKSAEQSVAGSSPEEILPDSAREEARRAAFKAEVLRLIVEDPDLRAEILALLVKHVVPPDLVQFENRLLDLEKNTARVWDLNRDAFRRPLPGVHLQG